MKIVPTGSTPSVTPATTPNAGASAQAARARAIARLQASTPPPAAANTQAPIPTDPNSVSPEEITSVQAPVETEENRQKGTDETLAAEPAPESTEATKAKEDPLSTQYAVLARKEKALRAKQQALDAQLKQREASIAAREEATKAKEAEYQSNYISKDKLTNDKLWSTLNELGISYDQLTEMALNQPKADPATQAYLQRLEDKIAKLEAGNTEVKKTFETQQAESYKQAVTQITNEAKQLVSNDPAYEMIKQTGSVSDVVELIEQTFKSDGILLTVEEAAEEVENYLVDEAIKLAKSKKIQQRLAAKPNSPAPSKAEVAAPTQGKQQQLKTLTNAVSTSKPLTAKERAILAFKGELKR